MENSQTNSINEILEKTTGPCIILAGAGTGKTRTITEKVRYLIRNKIYRPEEIVCLTFSNEAALAMESRIMGDSEFPDSKPIVRTFHALCADILKKYGQLININPNFRILTPDDAMIMLHKNLKIPAHLCLEYVSAIGKAKDLGITIEEYESFLNNLLKKMPNEIEKELESAQFELRTMHTKKASREEKHYLLEKIENLGSFIRRKKFLTAWKAYEKLKIKKNSQDYSDLNKNALTLLKENPQLAKEWKYIVVDEFQDTNKIQLEIISVLAKDKKNITIVGDLNQSIYRFRGAYKETFENFKKIFNVSEKEIFALDKSYRSPNTVLRLAHQIIGSNYSKKTENFEVRNANNREGNKILVYELKNEKEEVRKIIEIIAHELSSNKKPEDICVMFRTHQQANLLKKSLEQKGIQYQSTTKKPLLKHKIIKQIINYLKIINNLKNKTKGSANAWWEIINHLELPKNDQIAIAELIKKSKDEENTSKLLMEKLLLLNFSHESKLKIEGLIVKINKINESVNKTVPEIIDDLSKIFSAADLEKTKEGRENLLVLEEFKKVIKDYNDEEFFDLPTLLYHIEIMKALELELEAPKVENNGIKIMTAHATKGLEYPVVIVANLVQRKFPIFKIKKAYLIPVELIPEIKEEIKKIPSYLIEEAIEEYERENQLRDERRLCYVAFTRAKEKLCATYAKEYYQKQHEVSQFLVETNYKNNPDIEFIEDNEEKYQDSKNVQEISLSVENQHEKEITFSPSSLRLFIECRKKYEYKYVLNMPETEPISWEALLLGSFVHQIIEKGIKEGFSTEQTFLLCAREESLKQEWRGLDLNEALLLLKVFFERNKNKYNKNSKTEERLSMKIDGLNFFGIADRIDFHPDGIEIIDYKTGQSQIHPKERNFQLGYYALACEKFGKVKKVTLDMLKHDHPLEFALTKDGTAIEINTKRMSFQLEEVKKELVETAKQILQCYNSGFKTCPIEKNCEFCTEYVYG
ncbi:ATP-dependent helicase [Candidatus Pacearchaeota archaeon]|nr:ATP-dependent helicase [Candidatus Pacearchaeota archaeon]